jgi:branched-chain amino acid transport system substrate-binding protein
MKKYIALILVVIIMVGIALAASHRPKEKVIKIGIVAPLTGGAAVFGNSLVKGVEMALEDLEGAKYKYELVIEDDATNPANSASAANKLIVIDKVTAIISVTSGTGAAVAPITATNKVLHICVACADKKTAFGDYSYISSVLPEDEAARWIKEAVACNPKTIGILTMNHPGVNAIADEIKRQAEANGVKVIYEERFEGSNRDFKTIVAKAKAANADMYYVQTLPPALDIIGKDIKDLRLKNVAGGAGTFTIGAELSLFEGKWYTEATMSDQGFKNRFAEKYPETRFNIRTAPFGYDVFNIIVEGIESEEGLVAYMKGLGKYNGVVGNLSKDPENNYLKAIPGIWKIEDGQTLLIKE